MPHRLIRLIVIPEGRAMAGTCWGCLLKVRVALTLLAESLIFSYCVWGIVWSLDNVNVLRWCAHQDTL
jgi:hypothetical protein